VLPKDHIRIENVGGPGRRLLALRAGEVRVVTLLDPEIPIAEKEVSRVGWLGSRGGQKEMTKRQKSFATIIRMSFKIFAACSTLIHSGVATAEPQ
jgi:hypothetical protein